METATLVVGRDDDYFKLSFGVGLSEGWDKIEPNSIIIPDFTVTVGFRVRLNGMLFRSPEHEVLVETLGHGVLESEFWKDIEMTPNLFIGGGSGGAAAAAAAANEKPKTFLLNLYCNLFASLMNDFDDLKRNHASQVKHLQWLEIDFNYVTNSQTLSLDHLALSLDYLLVSLSLHLEQQYPLVFSFYGRQFFKRNYNWLVRNINEVLCDSDVDCEPGVQQQTKQATLLRMMQTLVSKCTSEFNTVQIMKQWTASSSKETASRKCRKKLLSGDFDKNHPDTPIDTMVFDLVLLDINRLQQFLSTLLIT